MIKFTVQNPLDDLTCTFCKMMAGTEVEDVEKAIGVPFTECENMDNEVKCRCYVAEAALTDKREILEKLESYEPKRMIQIGNDSGGMVVTVEFAIIVIDYIVPMVDESGFHMTLWP